MHVWHVAPPSESIHPHFLVPWSVSCGQSGRDPKRFFFFFLLSPHPIPLISFVCYRFSFIGLQGHSFIVHSFIHSTPSSPVHCSFHPKRHSYLRTRLSLLSQNVNFSYINHAAIDLLLLAARPWPLLVLQDPVHPSSFNPFSQRGTSFVGPHHHHQTVSQHKETPLFLRRQSSFARSTHPRKTGHVQDVAGRQEGERTFRQAWTIIWRQLDSDYS